MRRAGDTPSRSVRRESPERGRTLLDTLAEKRHYRVFEGTPTSFPRVLSMPPGWRAEDFMGVPELEGYVTIPEAAERMGVTEEQIESMAMRFLLSYQMVGATVYVRPAIVSEG